MGDRRRARLGAGLVALALTVTACGGDEADASLTGIVREPAPVVGEHTVPSLTQPGDDLEFRAESGGLQVVYFGYTNCPDVCPTTLADLTVALRKLPGDLADRVETVMVTVDPDRDLPILADYVRSFVPDAAAGGTEDDAVLRAAAEPFGVSYDVRTLDDGSVEVDHSPFLYAVNDQGELVLTWQFGASSDDMASDIEALLEQAEA
jgi:protein SCO1/2